MSGETADAGGRTDDPSSARLHPANPHSLLTPHAPGLMPNGEESGIPEPPSATPPWGVDGPTPGLDQGAPDTAPDAGGTPQDEDWGLPARPAAGTYQGRDYRYNRGGVLDSEQDHTRVAVFGTLAINEDDGGASSPTPSL